MLKLNKLLKLALPVVAIAFLGAGLVGCGSDNPPPPVPYSNYNQIPPAWNYYGNQGAIPPYGMAPLPGQYPHFPPNYNSGYQFWMEVNSGMQVSNYMIQRCMGSFGCNDYIYLSCGAFGQCTAYTIGQFGVTVVPPSMYAFNYHQGYYLFNYYGVTFDSGWTFQVRPFIGQYRFGQTPNWYGGAWFDFYFYFG